MLVSDDHRVGVPHPSEKEPVHLLPYLAAVQLFQLDDAVVYVRSRVMIVHQSGFFLDDGDCLLPALQV